MEGRMEGREEGKMFSSSGDMYSVSRVYLCESYGRLLNHMEILQSNRSIYKHEKPIPMTPFTSSSSHPPSPFEIP